jgi:hypothetical protein
MKKHSTFLFISLSVAAMSPQSSYAQMELPVWLQPSWIQAKLADFHARNVERYELAQANKAANTSSTTTTNGTNAANANAATNNGVLNPEAAKLQPKQTVSLAPVETAVPKLNEKHLTPEELKELRRQLRQQR